MKTAGSFCSSVPTPAGFVHLHYFSPAFDVVHFRATIVWRYSGPGVSCILVFQISDIKNMDPYDFGRSGFINIS
jgi:hypothetical protein